MKNKKPIKWLRYKILFCFVSIHIFAFGNPTIDLTLHLQNNIPPIGATLEWHNNLPINQNNLIPNATATLPGLYYAVYNFGGNCFSTPTAIRIATNTCPSTTLDLSKFIDTSAIPAGTTVTYHNALPANFSNQIGNTLVSAATSNTYYVAYYDATTLCYSATSVIITVPSNCIPVCTSGAPASTDLTTHNTSSTLPLGTTLEWQDTNGNPIANPNNAQPGIYNAVLNFGNGCFSAPSQLRIATNVCPAEKVDLTMYVDAAKKPFGTTISYHAASPVSVLNRLTLAQAMAVDSGTFFTAYYDAVGNCFSGQSVIVVVHAACHSAILNPDYITSFKNMPANGNVATNDQAVVGSTYGAAIPDSSNPNSCVPVVNPNGSYSFNCNTLGEYHFVIPVCEPAPCTICTSIPLTITNLDPSLINNAPVANTDYATVLEGNQVVLNIASNDVCQNDTNCVLGAPYIVTNPANGTFNVTTNVYEPNAGFLGVDSFEYAICDNQSPAPQCDTEWVYVTVIPANTPNMTVANDDYIQITNGGFKTGNAIVNDTDPQNNIQTIVPQTTTINGATLTLSANGSYSITTTAGTNGPVEFPYTTCDNGSPAACATATIKLLVMPTLLPLYIELAYFNATANACSVLLQWQPTDESLLNYVTIQRKTKNETLFSEIAKIPTLQNGIKSNAYTFTDNQVIDQNYLYRLQFVENNNGKTLSPIKNVQVNCNSMNNISVYPNPVNDFINIKLQNYNNEFYQIKIRDIAGRTIQTAITKADEKNKVQQIDLSMYPSGIYSIIVTSESETKIFKIEKK
jgi:Secretion system C-terminal sorting domain/Bacterial Ig domain